MADTLSEGRPAISGTAFDYHSVLRQMLEQNASDLHLKSGCAPTLRVDGELRSLPMSPMRSDDMKTLADQIMPAKRQKEFAEIKEADFALGVPGIGRFRVNAYQQRGTIAYAFRIVPFQAHSVSELNLPPIVEQIALKPRGLVLVTGITGSGKSTALAAMIQYINQNRTANIITIEDPIEILHRDNSAHINQREVGTDTAGFAQALRRVLRQDPDILLGWRNSRSRYTRHRDEGSRYGSPGLFDASHHRRHSDHQSRSLVLSSASASGVRFLLASALAVISLRLVPRADEPGRVPAAEILVKNGVISHENALYYAPNPSEVALRIQGVAGASDTTWDNISQDVTS